MHAIDVTLVFYKHIFPLPHLISGQSGSPYVHLLLLLVRRPLVRSCFLCDGHAGSAEVIGQINGNPSIESSWNCYYIILHDSRNVSLVQKMNEWERAVMSRIDHYTAGNT